MKVLWFANTPCEATPYLVGGPIKSIGWLYTLCEHLKKQDGIELHIAFFWGREMVAFNYKGVKYHPILRKGGGSMVGRYWHRLKNQFFDIDDKKEITRCLQIIHEVAPDIIHIHGSEESYGLITQDETISAPIVLSIQGLLSAYKPKYYSGISRSEMSRYESRLKKFCIDGIHGVFRSFCRRAERESQIFKSLHYVIGRTKWDKRCALILNPNADYFCVNEILRTDFMDTQWHRRSQMSPFTIVTTISSGIYKGLEVVYQTAKLLTEAKFSFRWRIIGLSSGDELVRVVERVNSVHALDIHIDLLGALSSDDMVQVLMDADMYVQVSHIENSPNSLCEAMAMGLPIIASLAGGTSSMLQDGVEGVLIQDGNSYELSGAIMEAKQNYAQYEAMGEAARRRALLRHNPDNVVRELMSVYNYLNTLRA